MDRLLFTILALIISTGMVKSQAFHQPDTLTNNACLPLRHLRLNSGYGWRIHPVTGKFQYHKGIDLAARYDTVFSILNGTVNKIGYNRLIGNYILIDHTGEAQSLYGHLSVIAVLPGEQVAAGQPIGVSGSSGRVTGPHLHFSIKYRGREIPPLAFLGGLFFRPP